MYTLSLIQVIGVDTTLLTPSQIFLMLVLAVGKALTTLTFQRFTRRGSHTEVRTKEVVAPLHKRFTQETHGFCSVTQALRMAVHPETWAPIQDGFAMSADLARPTSAPPVDNTGLYTVLAEVNRPNRHHMTVTPSDDADTSAHIRLTASVTRVPMSVATGPPGRNPPAQSRSRVADVNEASTSAHIRLAVTTIGFMSLKDRTIRSVSFLESGPGLPTASEIRPLKYWMILSVSDLDSASHQPVPAAV